MPNYFKLFVSPSGFIDELSDKKPNATSNLIIWSLVMLSLILDRSFSSPGNSGLKQEYLPLSLAVGMIMYYPVVYGFGYVLWIVGKGFKGTSRFVEIKDLVLFALFPVILKLPISLTFISINLLSGKEVIIQENYITQLVLVFFSFRILITGLARYNKFNWTIALVNWFLVTSVIGVVMYLIKH